MSERAQIVETFARTVEQHCPRGPGMEGIGHEDGGLWQALADGGWLDVGAKSAGDDALPLRDLAVLAIEWGRRLPPLPFASSALARRWFDIAPGSAERFSFALATDGGWAIPFGAARDVIILDAAGQPVPRPAGEDDAFAASLPLLRTEGATSPVMASEFRVLAAAEAIGAAAEALARAAAYAEERFAFGKPISSYQALRHWLADMHISLELAQSALLWAASASGSERARALDEGTREAQQVATRAIQVFGGVGFTWDLGVHAYLRHAMVARELARAPISDGDAAPAAPDTNARAEAFRAEVRDWLARVVPPAWRDRHEDRTVAQQDEIRAQWARILQQGGYSGLRWPVEYGGRGLGPAESMVFYEECARAGAPETIDNNPRSVGETLAGPAIIAFGTPAQKARHLPRILKGEEVWCEGFSEPGAGSDLAAAATTAVFDGEVYRVNGSKIWTTFGHKADYCYLLAKTSADAPRRENLSVFLFNMRQPGVTVRPIVNIAGEHEFNQVFFDDAAARPDDLLGELNGGWRMVTIGAASLRSSGGDGGTSVYWSRYVQIAALIERLLATANGGDAVRRRIEVFRSRLEVLRWTNARSAGLYGGEDGFPPLLGGANIVKIAMGELLQELSEFALDVAAPEHRAAWRREFLLARSRTIAGATSQVQRNVIADQILRLRKG